ncbi:MAG: phytoene dehydrogenase [Gemmatales bacterium]|nr:MAG: phytoene dehydrogenase [Gemmatales bacterium]
MEVLIVGGGLAGLSAATALAPRGFHVTLLESRNRLGGRASSFVDATSGTIIDNCQHVSMGCCTNFARFCRTLGLSRFLRPQSRLYFMTPDRRLSRFAADPWLPPVHLARSFFGLHFLTAADKLRIAWALSRLAASASDEDSPFADWLTQHRQSRTAIKRFWGTVLTSALNETPERIGLRYARKVFVDGFLRHRHAFEIELPTVPLSRFYGEELSDWFRRHQVAVRMNHPVRTILVENGKVAGVKMRDDRILRADWYIAAVPFQRLLGLLPKNVIEVHPTFSHLRRLQLSPITSVHLWYDQPILRWPHVVLIDSVGQWVFNRGETKAGEHAIQVVVSAARDLREIGQQKVLAIIVDELRRLFPAARRATLLYSRVVYGTRGDVQRRSGSGSLASPPGPVHCRICCWLAIGQRRDGRRRWKAPCAADTWRLRFFWDDLAGPEKLLVPDLV